MDPKVAIVTGASSGLGRAIALNYGDLGWKVVCADLRPDNPNISATTVDLINQETKVKAIYAETDVSSSKDIQALINTAVETFGRIDLLVNDAGISLESHGKLGPKLVADTDDSTFDTSWAVNVSKAAVVHMTKCIAREYGPSKIHVNAICPGFIKTEMDRVMLEDKKLSDATVALHPWGTLGTTADVAKATIFLATDQSAWITGVALPIDGGYMVA
ncbi:gluconate 5-dehydrogenase [Fusarium bulbicola]|nr:gluconate 5-dehydrogenase [Fusarium bulbicola]